MKQTIKTSNVIKNNVVNFMQIAHRKEVIELPHNITNSKEACNVFKSIWDTKTIPKHERVYAIFLNRNREIVATELINIGGYESTLIEVRTILEFAFNCNSSNIVIAHNHPSGSAKPSEADIAETNRIKSVLIALKMNLIDHIIITETEDYYSLRDNKILN